MASPRLRLDIFDGLRGHLLIGMLVAHLSFFDGMHWLKYFHHDILIQLYDAEFFVLIAGLLIGYLWVNAYKTPHQRVNFVKKRLLTIYRYYLFSALPFLLYLFAQGEGNFSNILGIFTMQLGGWYSDILPIYFVCFILILPFAMISALNKPTWILLSSFIIYVGSQVTQLNGFFGFADRFVVFDVSAWQFLFMCSVLLGQHCMTIFARIQTLTPRTVMLVMAALISSYTVLTLSKFYPDPLNISQSIGLNDARFGLHPVYLVRIILASSVIAILLIRNDVWFRPIHRLMHWYFGLQVIKNVGKYSIQMFVFHVYIMALYKVVFVSQADLVKAIYAVFWISVFIVAPSVWIYLKQRRMSHA